MDLTPLTIPADRRFLTREQIQAWARGHLANVQSSHETNTAAATTATMSVQLGESLTPDPSLSR